MKPRASFLGRINMDKILLRPVRSEVQYQGRFESLIFGLLTGPAPLYQNLLKHLGKYGATLHGITYVAPPSPDANISCLLSEVSANIQVRLDRLELNFLRFHEVGSEVAKQFLLESWAALHEIDSSILVVEHAVGITVHTQILEASYDQLIGRYVTTPQGLGENVHAGVAFYLPEDRARGERSGGVVLDRFLGQEQGMLLKVTAVFDAVQISFAGLVQSIEDYLIRYLDHLSLALEQGKVG
jgi:hypothetical protein